MHFQPVPTRPPGRQTAALSILSVAAAPLILVLVVAFAWLGGTPSPGPAVDRLEARDADRLSTPSPVPEASRDPSRAFAPDPPEVAFRLRTVRVEDALERHAAAPTDELIAVAGYLSIDRRREYCLDGRGVSERQKLCTRFAVLSSGPEPFVGGGSRLAGPGAIRPPHLHAQVLPGTPLPTAVLAQTPGPLGVEPVLAVVIGRFGDPRAIECAPRSRHCGEEFVLERVPWIDGAWHEREPVVDPMLSALTLSGRGLARRVVAMREVDRGEVVLGQALLTPEGLAIVDPAAAAELPAGHGGALWYIRSVGRADRESGRRSAVWVVVDHATGLILAEG